MDDKQLIEQAREQLPGPETVEGNYTEVTLTLNNGKQQLIRFTKIISDGEVTWMDLPLNP